jgi:hypothetical protein
MSALGHKLTLQRNARTSALRNSEPHIGEPPAARAAFHFFSRLTT